MLRATGSLCFGFRTAPEYEVLEVVFCIFIGTFVCWQSMPVPKTCLQYCKPCNTSALRKGSSQDVMLLVVVTYMHCYTKPPGSYVRPLALYSGMLGVDVTARNPIFMQD